MAYLTINSTFNPYSFDELIKPFAMYDTAYREQEAYLDAARELDNSGGMFNQESTPIAYGMYSTANDSLRAVSDELATNGLSSDLKSRLRNTVRDYRSTMKTLNSAQERYYAEQDRRAKLGPDYVFQQGNLSVDDFLGGKSPNQRGESLTNITKDIATQFSARAQQITNDTWNRVLGSNGKVVGGYYDITSESGLTAAQLDTILNTDNKTWNSIMNNSGISDEQKSILQGFRNTITAKLNNIGYNDYDDYSRGKIDEAIAIGATSALGSTTHKYVQEPGYNPLGWQQYNDNKAQRLLELRLKYPQYQFDNNGNVKTDKDGNLIYSDGWKQDEKGRWIGPNGQVSVSSGSSDTELNPEIGVVYYDSTGARDFYDSATQWHGNLKNPKADRLAASGADLSDENASRLAIELGLDPEEVNKDYIYSVAKSRGIVIGIVGDATTEGKVYNEKTGKKEKGTVSNSKQQMILQGRDFKKTGTIEESAFSFNDDNA